MCILPRSSGCSMSDRQSKPRDLATVAAASARMEKWMNSFPFLALRCWPALWFGKPQGWSLSLQGCGG